VDLKSIAILIPSYKRPDVLKLTLDGLYRNTTAHEGYNITICVGLNQASGEEMGLMGQYEGLFRSAGIQFNWLPYSTNIGKASILNTLFARFADGYELVVTMDNDMVISKPWLHLIKPCLGIDFDIMGFSSSNFWAHEPSRERCSSKESEGYTFYSAHGIAGGMMLFHHSFLQKHPWTNHGGVYGRDDADMCLKTQKKYVIFYPEGWLAHDPLVSSTPELKSYEDKKRALYMAGTTVFPKGWDE